MPCQNRYSEDEHQEFVGQKRAKRMARVDAFDPPIRQLIHEYGLPVVQTLHDVGVTKPKHIRHVVETILNEFSPTRGSYSKQGIRTDHE